MADETLDFLSKATGLPVEQVKKEQGDPGDPIQQFLKAAVGTANPEPINRSSGYNDPLDSATRAFNLSSVYTDPLESYGKAGASLNPYADWNEQRAQRQSTFDKWTHGLTKAGITLVGAVAENTLGVLAGFGEMATGGEYYDNFIGKGIDNVNEWAQENLPNYYSKAEQNASVLAGMGTANFWADKVANGVGYSLGSIATMWLGTGELGLLAKGVGKTASLASKTAKAVGIGGKAGAVLEDAAMLGSKQLSMYRAGKAIQTGEKLERMAGVARFSTAAQRLGVATQMSLAEASVEARETKNRFIEEQTAKWQEENPGQALPDDVMNGILESANAAGNTAFAINLPILATSNLIMFGKMFKGASVGERAIYDLAEKEAASGAKAAVWAEKMGDTKLAKTFTKAGRMFGKTGEGIVTEGLQEGSQFAASEFSRDYYGSKFSDGFGDMSKSISQSLSATFGTKEGLENMLIGAIVGGGTGTISRIAGADSKLAKEKTANSQKALEALNSGGLTKVMETMEQNDYNVRRANIMENAQKIMSNADATSSQKMQAKQAFERAQTQLIRSEARRYSKMGALDYFMEQLDDAKAMPEKEFKEAFGFNASTPLLDQAGKSQSEIVDGVKKTVELSEKRALQVEAILAKHKPKATLIPKLMESFQSDKTKNNKQIQGVVRNMYASMLHERLLDIDVLDSQIDDTYRELEKLSPAISNMGMEEFVYQINVGNIRINEEGKVVVGSRSDIKADKKLADQLNEIYIAKKRLNPADSMEFRDVALGLAELLKSREIAATAMDNLTRNPEEMDLVMQYEYAKKQQDAKQANAERAAQVVAGAETADEIRNNLPEDASPEMIAEAEAKIAQLEEEENIARASMAAMSDEEIEAVNEDELPPTAASALAKEKDERENAERIRQQQRSINSPQIEQVDTPQQSQDAASYVDTVERMQEVSDAEEAALGDISISAGGKIFTINGTTYLNLYGNPTDAIMYDENGERIGVELTDAATGVKVSWKLSEENEEDSAIVDSTTYAILLNAEAIRSDEEMAKQSNAEASTILQIRMAAMMEDALEKQTKEIEAAQERAKGKLKNFELSQSQEDFEAFEKEQAEVAKLVATTNLGETKGMTDSQIRSQIEVIKQDLIEFYEILDEERKIGLSENPNLTEKEFNERPSVITVKAITKTHEALFEKKVKELRERKQAAKVINVVEENQQPAPPIEEAVPQSEVDELLQSTANKIKRLEDEIAEFAKYADEYQKMVDGTYPDQNVEWASAKLKRLETKIATRKANIQKEKDLIQRINEERKSEELRQAGDTAEGTDTTVEGEEPEATDLNPRAGSTEEGLDGTTTDEELELIRQRFEEQSKFEDEDPTNFEEPVDATELEDNDVTLTVEGPMDIQLSVGSVTPGKNPDGSNNWNVTIVGDTGASTNRMIQQKVDGTPVQMYPEMLTTTENTPVDTVVIFEVDETVDWWNSDDPTTSNNKKDLTEDRYWEQVPIYMVAILPNGTKERVGMLQSANSDSGASRRDIYELYKKGLTPSATIVGKKFNKSNIANARTNDGQTFFYPANTIAGTNPVIAVVSQRDGETKWIPSTNDGQVAVVVGSASTDNVVLGQVAIVVNNPDGAPTVIVASTKDMTPEGATKAIDYIIADEPQPELYSEIVGVNRLPVNIESEEDTIKIEGQTEDPFSERFIATNKLTDGTEVFSFYSKSANSIVRLNATELKKALLGQPFKFSFSEAAPNEKGWVDLTTVKKPDVAYKAVEGNLAQEFKDITMSKKFQVSLASMANPQKYVSPITGKTYDTYFQYLSSTEEFGEPRSEGKGANAILTVDTLANGLGSPFYDVGVKLSQLTTLEGDVKTKEEMELKQVVETSKPAPQTQTQPAAPSTDPRVADIERRKDLSKLIYENIGDNDVVGEVTVTYIKPFDYSELDNIKPINIQNYVFTKYGEKKSFSIFEYDDIYKAAQDWLDSKYNAELAALEGKAATPAAPAVTAPAVVPQTAPAAPKAAPVDPKQQSTLFRIFEKAFYEGASGKRQNDIKRLDDITDDQLAQLTPETRKYLVELNNYLKQFDPGFNYNDLKTENDIIKHVSSRFFGGAGRGGMLGQPGRLEFPEMVLPVPSNAVLVNIAISFSAKLTDAELNSGRIETVVPIVTTPAVQPAPAAAQTLPGPETKINIYAGTGENAELSNFANRPFIASAAGLDEDEWPAQGKFNTVEGAYQAQKIAYASKATEEENKFNLEILAKLRTASGAQAKSLGRQIKSVDTKDWDKDSSTVMKNLLLESFDQNPDALAKLLATGDATLTHTQDKGKWGKEFPKLLMEVREELSSVENVPAATTPAVVQAPAAPKLTSSSQVIEDDLSLLTNLSRNEEKPVPSATAPAFDMSRFAVSPEKQAELRADQAAELKKSVGKPVVGPPVTDFGDLRAEAKKQGEQNKKNC